MAAVAKFVWKHATMRNAIALAVLYAAAKRLQRRLRCIDLNGKTVLITGGANGIGRDAAFQFARKGATVVLWDIDEAGLAATKADVEATVRGSKVWTYKVDMSKREVVYEAARAVQADVGFVYCVVNNCGIVSGKLLLQDVPDEKVIRTFAVNTLAIVWTIKAFLPAMIERNSGHFVTVSSIASFFPAPRMGDYSASKHGSRAITEALRQELRSVGATGVHTTCLCPGHVKTGLFKGFSTLVPSLEPAYVAERIVESVQKLDTRVILPWYLVFAVVVQEVSPQGLVDVLNYLMGASTAMNTWRESDTHRKVFALMEQPERAEPAAPTAGLRAES